MAYEWGRGVAGRGQPRGNPATLDMGLMPMVRTDREA